MRYLLVLLLSGCTITGGLGQTDSHGMNGYDQGTVGIVRIKSRTQPAVFCEHVSYIHEYDYGTNFCGVSVSFDAGGTDK